MELYSVLTVILFRNFFVPIFTCVHVCYFATKQRDILLCAEHLDQLEQDFHANMDKLKDTVQSKTAVPTAQVYVSLLHFTCRVLIHVYMCMYVYVPH